jgi:hypothetical protein
LPGWGGGGPKNFFHPGPNPLSAALGTITHNIIVDKYNVYWNLLINVEKHSKRHDHMYAYHIIKPVTTAVIAAMTDNVVIMRA